MTAGLLEKRVANECDELPSVSYPLPDSELDASHADDRHAAKIIACLLAGIFTIGLAMYTYIWWLVAND